MSNAQHTLLTLVGERIGEIQDFHAEKGLYLLRVKLVLQPHIDPASFMQQQGMEWHVGTLPNSLTPLVARRVEWSVRDTEPNVVNVALYPPDGVDFFRGVDWDEGQPLLFTTYGIESDPVRQSFLRSREAWIRMRQVSLVIVPDDERWPTRTFMKVLDPRSAATGEPPLTSA